MAPKRRSTQAIIRSRMISPEMPAVVAVQAIASRSWQSRAKATRTISPFQQVNSRSLRAPTGVRVQGHDLAIMGLLAAAAGMPGEQ